MSFFNYKRRECRKVRIGNTEMGGNAPIRLQSMASVPTLDTDASVAQARRIFDAGGELVRFAAQGTREAQNLRNIREALNKAGYNLPLVADIHFNPAVAEEAALHVEKVRINPGNFVARTSLAKRSAYSEEEYAEELKRAEERLIPLLNLCKQHGTAIRIGVNHGSLSERIMSRYGDTPQGMVESCMEFLRICRSENFEDVVVSIKASNTAVMVQTVRLLARQMEKEGLEFPLHLGVTEAGEGEDGRIKSAVGIGALLADGIGDTIRVSLSEEPEKEIPVAKKLVQHILKRENHPYIQAKSYPGYDPVFHSRRISRAAGNIGGNNPPVVIAVTDNNSQIPYTAVNCPDYIYLKGKDRISYEKLSEEYPRQKFLVNGDQWNNSAKNTYPVIPVTLFEKEHWNAPLIFTTATRTELNNDRIRRLSEAENAVLLLSSNRRNLVGSERGAMHLLMSLQCDIPVVISHRYIEPDIEYLQIKAAADFGTLLLDGFSDGIMLFNQGPVPPQQINSCMFAILQAARVRTSRTEYISCPGCGRTLFDLQKTVAEVKQATSLLKGLKIAVMGCIVNGPGEMADADYGYIGAKRGRIDLYKGKKCVLKNIPEGEAVKHLIDLIKENGDWVRE